MVANVLGVLVTGVVMSNVFETGDTLCCKFLRRAAPLLLVFGKVLQKTTRNIPVNTAKYLKQNIPLQHHFQYHNTCILRF